MDQAALRAKLQSAKLVIGDVAVTVKQWLRDSIESPLGFVAFDLDYYSSTKAALALLDGPESTHLPRVHCYFDDLAAGDQSCMNRYVGEYLAIDEFNAAHEDRKICLIEQTAHQSPELRAVAGAHVRFPQLFAREVHTGGSTRRHVIPKCRCRPSRKPVAHRESRAYGDGAIPTSSTRRSVPVLVTPW
jgi:hypothetical protein